MKSDATPTRYTSNGLEFSDGTELSADLIVFTTGFMGDLREGIARIVGEEIGDQLEDYWLVDQEGELLGAFKPSGRLYCPCLSCRRHAELPPQIRRCGTWVAPWRRHATCRALWLCRFKQISSELLLKYIGRRHLGIE